MDSDPNPKTKAMADRMIAAVKSYVARAIEARYESLERRASRHAEHLARLETRLQALERGGK